MKKLSSIMVVVILCHKQTSNLKSLITILLLWTFYTCTETPPNPNPTPGDQTISDKYSKLPLLNPTPPEYLLEGSPWYCLENLNRFIERWNSKCKLKLTYVTMTSKRSCCFGWIL